MATAYEEAVLADGPTGFWMLDEQTGTAAANRGSGSGAGTYQGSPILAGVPTPWGGRAPVFNGSSQYVTIAETDMTGEWTAEAWVRPTAQADTAIVGQWGSGSATQEWILGTTSTSVEIFVHTGVGYSGLTASAWTLLNRWHHVVGIRSTTANESQLWVNGRLIAIGTVSAAGNKTQGVEIARKGGSAYYTGAIAGVAIYDGKVLPRHRIAAHYRAGLRPAQRRAFRTVRA